MSKHGYLKSSDILSSRSQVKKIIRYDDEDDEDDSDNEYEGQEEREDEVG